MLFGGSFAIKSWVNRKKDINIDVEFVKTANEEAAQYFRVALQEQVLKYGGNKRGIITEGRTGGLEGRAVSRAASPEKRAQAAELVKQILEAVQKGQETFMGKPIQGLLNLVRDIEGG
jgi:hypothetical protein